MEFAKCNFWDIGLGVFGFGNVVRYPGVLRELLFEDNSSLIFLGGLFLEIFPFKLIRPYVFLSSRFNF